MEVNHAQLAKVLDWCYKSKPPTPLYIWGATGVGKSMGVAAMAEKWAAREKRGLVHWNEMTKEEKIGAIKDPSEYFIFADIRLSQYDPSDLKGIPKIISDIDASEWHIPMLFKAMGHTQAKGVVFFDEMNLASPSILASCYQVIHDRQIGEYPINPGIVMLGAGNRAEDRANVFDMPAPLKNRFGHVTLVVPSMKEWTPWAVEHDVDGRVLGFLNFKESYLHNFKKAQKEPAFATPRAWVVVSKMIEDLTGVTNVRDAVSMIVGEGTGAEFAAFVKLANKYDIEHLLKHPQEVKKLKETDIRWSVVTSVAEVYRKAKGKKRVGEVVEGVCGVADALDIEFGILLMRLVHRSKKNWLHDFLKSTMWDKVAKKYAKFLSDTEE